jgi:hypothetical protein
MLTVTIRHHAGVDLGKLLRGLTASWRKTRQGGPVQRIWSERVRASVRATEITWGHENGWHPHVHVLLATSEWSEEDRATLLERFRSLVAKELGEDFIPNEQHALRWSRSFDADDADAVWLATYVSKFSCEVSGIAKESKGGLSPWDIGARAAKDEQKALRLWQDYESSTRGRRALELDDRAAAAAKDWLEWEREKNDAARGETPATVPERDDIMVTRDELRSLRLLERTKPDIMWAVLDAAERSGPAGVRDWVTLAQWRTRTIPGYSQAHDEKTAVVRGGTEGTRAQGQEAEAHDPSQAPPPWAQEPLRVLCLPELRGPPSRPGVTGAV